MIYNVRSCSVHSWVRGLLRIGNVFPMPKKEVDTTAVIQETVISLK